MVRGPRGNGRLYSAADPATGGTGPIGYWQVDDIHATMSQLLDEGAEVHQEVRDVGGGRLIASVKDADGNVIGILQDV